MLDAAITVEEMVGWLRQTDDTRLADLWRAADETRRRCVGNEVHLRGLIEISNHCVRSCTYCGLRAGHATLDRYRMTEAEILSSAHDAVRFGYGTVVMQSGEDYGITTEWLAAVIRRIKSETDLAVTLSVGERPHEDLAAWREAGADRYLLRFETSDPRLYEIIHPSLPDRKSDRLAILEDLQALGYEIGGGVMIGIPGQTYGTLARDINVFREFDMDMIGVGPYIANPDTPLGAGDIAPDVAPEDQAPNDEQMACKVIALTRLVCPEANIPSTTALATIDKEQGRALGLARGGNVVMPNVTPPAYRAKYEIYPDKACSNETAEVTNRTLVGLLDSMGRTIGKGRGDRKRHA